MLDLIVGAFGPSGTDDTLLACDWGALLGAVEEVEDSFEDSSERELDEAARLELDGLVLLALLDELDLDDDEELL